MNTLLLFKKLRTFALCAAFILVLYGHCLAAQKYGIIIVSDSGNAKMMAVSKRIDKFCVILRDKNPEAIEKDTLWIKHYDYNVPAHAEFIKTVLGVDRSAVPFVGLAYLNDDQSFNKFIPESKMNNVSDGKNIAEKIMEKYCSTLSVAAQSMFNTKITGFEHIATDPGDAEVYINNKFAGKTPLNDVFLKPGANTLKITKEGFADYVKSFNLEAGDFSELDVKMELGLAKVTVTSSPSGSSVYVDGEDKGRTPVTLELKPGSHTISIAKNGYKDAVKTADFKPNSVSVENFRLEARKIKCHLETKGYYAMIRIRTGPRTFREVTLTVDPEILAKNIKSLLSEQDYIEITSNKGEAKFYIVYEASPGESELTGTLRILKSSGGEKILEKSETVDMSASSDQELADQAVELFKKKLMPLLQDALMKNNY
ncbi:MAG: PEGA domain-containing protein [Firmicutes bacterium]|nr:PEGA domain-containing protein [Bacillota bacterium]